ncbi:MAG: glutamine synthetase adenylyltransferase [Planctomyces sp.]|nr:glutamine synthetase adenylyltransferase [Planctomyces sp.]
MFPRFEKLIEAEKAYHLPFLEEFGFRDPALAWTHLGRIRSRWLNRRGSNSAEFTAMSAPQWYETLQRVLREAPLRDTVLAVVDQFIRNADQQVDPFALFEQSPRSLDVLARVACGSPFLTQTLLSDPTCLTALTVHGRTADVKSREQFVMEAELATEFQPSRTEKLRELRRYQRRELLRIGMCDAFGLLDLRYVTLQLSLLADAMVQISLNLAAAETRQSTDLLAVIALGKHGGEELNYSSDIDLVLIAERDAPELQRLARLTIDGLADNLPPGFLYRVDLRLRPWGDAGPLLSTIDGYAGYLRNDAALWEKQALLKARVVAGNAQLGRDFLKTIRPLLFAHVSDDVPKAIQLMKEKIELRLRQRGKLNTEVKLGVGSIRDVEFLVQCLQLTHGRTEPRILSCNTLESLVRLTEFGLLPSHWYRQLRAGYVFLRTLEHSLQLLHNQQTHELPNDSHQMNWLANRLDYPNSETLIERFEEHRRAVRAIFEEGLGIIARPPEALLPGPAPDRFGDQSSSGTQTGDSAKKIVFLARSSSPADERALIESLLRKVSEETPVVTCTEQTSEVTTNLLVAGIEFSGWLSATCGLLSTLQLDIQSGEAITGNGTNQFGHLCPERRFLACLRVNSANSQNTSVSLSELADRLREELSRYSRMVREGSQELVREELISRFCAGLNSTIGADAAPAAHTAVATDGGVALNTATDHAVADDDLAELDVSVTPDDPTEMTMLKITGTDTRGFLFELSHALSISRFRIRRAIIDSENNRVSDILYVTERDGRPVREDERIQELRVAVVFIKQFTHWLPSTNDPHQALLRFRELLVRLQPANQWSENIASLQKPSVLHAVARVLGISQYLWENFLRSRHEELFPLLANVSELGDRICREALTFELDAMLASCCDTLQAWQTLNAFKDRHLFRIDMRHVLGHCRPFGVFSEEITELAEIVVRAAVDVAWKELVSDFGTPSNANNNGTCRFCVAGLGKFGGIEMGFASDIELMLVYENIGQTTGENSISNSRFFDQLVGAVANGISARQDGIFHVDLRMRPYGQAGSAAVSIGDFIAYYQTDGPAWPYERQALVKLRCVAGDVEFAEAVTSACHAAIYSAGHFDFSAMRAMRERQVRQLVRGGTINAKLSDGGLVDCEYAVQAIQLTFAAALPSLRHPNTRRSLHEAARLSLIDPHRQKAVDAAYVFLREIVDCLRMVRGNARDLTIPEVGSADYEQLSRRMQSIHASQIPLSGLETQMNVLREFSQWVQHHCLTMRRTQVLPTS